MKKAFTLIELLVVIAIIAILAAILFPVFAQAKNSAKQSADLSNMKQIGLAFMMYSNDHDDTLPSAYFHRAWNGAGGTAGGYVHWSAKVQPYVKSTDIFVSPGDKIGGHAPTCFSSTDNNKGKGWPSGQQANRCPGTGFPNIGGNIVDDQVPRLSYTVNSAVIPRLRNVLDQQAGIRVVSVNAVDSPSGTIVVTGMTDNLACLNGQSLGTGIRNSSHRSTNAVTPDRANAQQWRGENTDAAVATLYALNHRQITTGSNQIFNLCKQGIGTLPLITYASVDRWKDGDNYAMADGSAKHRKFAGTIAPNNYMWGMRMYTALGQAVLDPISGQPVTQ